MGIAPESEPPRTDITCDDCGACCRGGIEIILSSQEAALNAIKINRRVKIPAEPVWHEVTFLNKVDGTTFDKFIPPNTEISELISCGHLTEDNRCAIFGKESPYRSQACINFEPGSEACMYERGRAGIIDPPRPR